ncbi:MAG: sulfite exporter TauE/SafE family protein, partial [Campylobacter sp.]
MDYLSVLNIASVAVLSSFSHCIGMCGGFISLQALFLRGKSGAQAMILSLLYHLCRVGAYTCLGALAGGLSGALIIGKNARAGLFFAVGCALIFIGAALYFRGGMLKFLENEKISKFIALKALKFSKKQGVLNLCALGFLNGLLPCGVVYYVLAQAISYGYYSGEGIVHLNEGRPLFVRMPESQFNLANFLRSHLYASLGAVKIGLDILLKDEKVKVTKIMGHGGLFKT